jgi:hypothetical protein
MEAERFAALVRESERIDAADMNARGYVQGTKPISDRLAALQRRMTVPPTLKTREELAADADALWAQHEGKIRQREH